MRGRRFAGAGLMRRGGREPAGGGAVSVSAWAAQTKALLDAVEAGSALNAWVPDPATTTLNGTNISAIADSWGAAPQEQATAANQPAYVANGGPGARPYVNLQDVARRLVATTIFYADGNRVGAYVVGRCSGADNTNLAHVTDGPPSAGVHSFRRQGGFLQQLTFTGPVGEPLIITVPAFDTAWHVFANRPIATGALSQIDHATTTPNYTSGAALFTIERAAFGRYAADESAGDVAGLFLVNNPTAAKDLIMKTQLQVLFRGTFPR